MGAFPKAWYGLAGIIMKSYTSPHRNGLRTLIAALGLALAGLQSAIAGPVTIALSPVGNPNNPNDGPLAMGTVGYSYYIGSYDVTLNQYAAFLNAVAATDTYGLYTPSLTTDPHSEGIARSGTPGKYRYTVIGGSGKHPVTHVSWLDAARFCNWMHNGEPTTLGEVAGSTEAGAYPLNGDLNVTGTTGRESANPGALWRMPLMIEWFKGAYYDPTLNFGTGGYWDYPTQSDAMPGNDGLDPALPNQMNIASQNGLNIIYSTTQKVYSASADYITPVGLFTKSASYYKTYDQGGDVSNWLGDGPYPATNGMRLIVGSNWSAGISQGDPLTNLGSASEKDLDTCGFRVATGASPIEYTVLLRATRTAAAVPQGTGYATLTVGRTGVAMMGGNLPDGEAISLSGTLVPTATGPRLALSESLAYPDLKTKGAKGALTGTLDFVTEPGTSDLHGTLQWVKPAQTAGAYPAAISVPMSVVGSAYAYGVYGTNMSVLPNFLNGTLDLTDAASLSVTGKTHLNQTVSLVSNVLLVDSPVLDQLTVAINPVTGIFRGSFVYPGATVRTSFGGVLYQDNLTGRGFFLGPHGSGTVSLTK